MIDNINIRLNYALGDVKYLMKRLIFVFSLISVKSINLYGTQTALYEAITGGDIAKVKSILATGIEALPNVTTWDGKGPLREAVRQNNPELVKMLLAIGAKPNIHSKRGKSPLIEAVRNNNPELVKILLAAGANLKASDLTYRRTPLAWAAGGSSPEVVSLLLSAGADSNAKDWCGNTPLCVALQQKNTNPETVKILLIAGSDLNAIDFYGYTPLMRAAGKNKFELVTMLLKYGADIDIRNKRDQTAFGFVIGLKNKAMAQYISQAANDLRKLKEAIQPQSGALEAQLLSHLIKARESGDSAVIEKYRDILSKWPENLKEKIRKKLLAIDVLKRQYPKQFEQYLAE